MILRFSSSKQSGNANAVLIVLVAIAAALIGYMAATMKSEKELFGAQILSGESSLDLNFLKDVSFSDPRGKPIVFQDILASRTVVNFWATWCAPCRREMPTLQAFYDVNQANDISVIGLTLDDPEPTERFIQELGISYPILIMTDQALEITSKAGNPEGLLPYTVLVDEKGVVLEKKFGEMHMSDFKKWLEKHPIVAK